MEAPNRPEVSEALDVSLEGEGSADGQDKHQQNDDDDGADRAHQSPHHVLVDA